MAYPRSQLVPLGHVFSSEPVEFPQKNDRVDSIRISDSSLMMEIITLFATTKIERSAATLARVIRSTMEANYSPKPAAENSDFGGQKS